MRKQIITNIATSVDLSGAWELNQTYSLDMVLQSPKKRGREGGSGDPPGGGDRSERGGTPKDGSSERRLRPEKTYSMKATQMIITQNNDSMGIAYQDEKYRNVDWGKPNNGTPQQQQDGIIKIN